VSFYNCHDGNQNQSLQPGRRHRLHPVERPAIESRGEGVWEEMEISESIYPQFEIQFLGAERLPWVTSKKIPTPTGLHHRLLQFDSTLSGLISFGIRHPA
jgi:hypothetical protein